MSKVCFVYTNTRTQQQERTRFFLKTSGSILKATEKALRRTYPNVQMMTKEAYEALNGAICNEARPVLPHFNIALDEPTQEMKLWRMQHGQPHVYDAAAEAAWRKKRKAEKAESQKNDGISANTSASN